MSLDEKKVSLRTATLELRAAEGDTPAQVRMSISSEEPVLTYLYFNEKYQRAFEILDHGEGSVDMSRCKDGLVVLDRHNGDQVGLMAVEISDRKLGGPVAFCTGARAKEIEADAAKGLRRNVSVGYVVRAGSYRLEGERDGIPVVRAMSWMPYEASFEPVPADTTVGVGRADNVTAPVVSVAETVVGITVENKERTMDAKEMAEMFTRAAKHGIDAAAVQKLVDEGKGRAELDAMIVERQAGEIVELRNKKPEVANVSEVKQVGGTPEIGLSAKEARRYSFINAMRALMGDRSVDVGFERECSDAVAQRLGRAARGLFVPYDVQVRDLQITGGGTGANVVATNLLAGNFITALRNAMALPKLGVTTLTGLVGDIAIPKGGTATGYWIAETATPTESTPTLSQVTGSPKGVGATVDISRKLLLQSSIDVEAYVRNEIAEALAKAIDAAAFNGAGTSEPTGLLTGPISTDVSMTAGSVTYADICSMISTVTGKNVMFDNIRFAVTNEVFWKLAATATSTNGPVFIADYNTNRILGRPAIVSENVTTNYGFVGDWSQMILAMWGNGLDLTVDPYSGSKSGLVSVTGFMDADILVKNADAFAHADITT